MIVTLLLCAVLQDSAPVQPATPETSAAICAEDLAGHVRVLASDAFGGRGPGQYGEEKTVAYMIDRFKAFGLEPAGDDGGWTQAVPMRELTPIQAPSSSYEAGFGKQDLVFGRDVMIFSAAGTDPIALTNSPMVFAGYGIVAPEFGWNDYEGIDVKGKTVVVLVNDPGYASRDPELFRGNAMTYYGRWTYKYEEAARQGAAGCLIIHETGAAGYPWHVVVQGWGRPQLYLAADEAAPAPTPIQGWLTEAAAADLFKAGKHDLAGLMAAAQKPGAHPTALTISFTSFVHNTSRDLTSANIAAKIVGSEHPEETVLVCAHWDHLGDTQDGTKDSIYNGAHDNATGTAALLELAEALANSPQKPKRTILFLSITAEEKGLLGSAYYARAPLVPLATTVCGINIDGLNSDGPMDDIVVVGYGASELDADLALAAIAQGRRVSPEATPEKGSYFRSDHFSLAKVGVPMLYTTAGTTSTEHGADWVTERRGDYVANRYHRASDEYHEDWDLSGAADDVRLFHALLARWANEPRWPAWAPTSEFLAARKASQAK